jgi:hypothetical protein
MARLCLALGRFRVVRGYQALLQCSERSIWSQQYRGDTHAPRALPTCVPPRTASLAHQALTAPLTAGEVCAPLL